MHGQNDYGFAGFHRFLQRAAAMNFQPWGNTSTLVIQARQKVTENHILPGFSKPVFVALGN